MKIGLLIQDLASDYSSKIVKGTKKYCLENNVQLFIFIVRSKTWDKGIYDYQHFACKSLATKHNLDGIVLVTNTYCQGFPKEEHLSVIQDLLEVPLVSFGEELPGLSSVTGNERISFNDLLTHLADNHGCKNIYLMGPKSSSKDIIQRFNVYKEFMSERNQNFEDKIIYTDYSFEKAKLSLSQMKISRDNLPFDALVCCNDSMALGSISYLKEQGIRIPEDVKVTGFDNQLRCDFTKPTLTTIDQCIDEQCYKAVELLCQEIQDRDIEKQNCNVEAQVVLRHSCGCNFKRRIDDSMNEGRYFHLHSQLQKFHYFLQELQLKIDINKIINYYKGFGIESCVCCIYEKPEVLHRNEDFSIPEKAKIFLAYNKDKVFEYGSDFRLNPKKNMCPEDFVFESGKEVIVTALFVRDYQYGYIVFTPGDLDYNTYDLIITTTGVSLINKIFFFRKNQEKRKLEEDKKSLESKNYFDELTGILNRRGFNKYAGQALQDAVERNLCGGIIFGDMDYLKFINDNYGHDAGDRGIKRTAEFLKSIFRTEDLVARLGGDEFVVYSSGLTSESFEVIKRRLEEKMKAFNDSGEEPFKISISLGFVAFDKNNCNLDDLIKKADEDQYTEKSQHHESRG